MALWWTSDEHYGHANIIRFCGRPFRDVDHMREELIRRHNERVGSDDLVRHVGDFSMNPAAVASLLRRLNGHHVLVVGNHDKCHPCHKRHQRWREYYMRAGFVDVVQRLELPFDGWAATHMPATDFSDPRYPEWRPSFESFDVLLHGHVHERWKVRRVLRRSRLEDDAEPVVKVLLNVGVDQWDFAPVSEAEVQRTVAAALRENVDQEVELPPS